MLSVNFKPKKLRHRAVSLRQHGFLETDLPVTWHLCSLNIKYYDNCFLYWFHVKQNKLPKTQHVADYLCIYVGETAVTHCSPDTLTKNFQTSFVRTRTSYQSHCKTTQASIQIWVGPSMINGTGRSMDGAWGEDQEWWCWSGLVA